MIDYFAKLIQDLGDLNDIELFPDALNTCSLVIDDELTVQLELNNEENKILVASFLCELPPGVFRANVLFDTLRANDMEDKLGIFGFCEANSSLVLFDYLLFEDFPAKKLNGYLSIFIEKAKNWKKAIESGKTAPVEFARQMQIFIKKPSPMPGLKR